MDKKRSKGDTQDSFYVPQQSFRVSSPCLCTNIITRYMESSHGLFTRLHRVYAAEQNGEDLPAHVFYCESLRPIPTSFSRNFIAFQIRYIFLPHTPTSSARTLSLCTTLVVVLCEFIAPARNTLARSLAHIRWLLLLLLLLISPRTRSTNHLPPFHCC